MFGFLFTLLEELIQLLKRFSGLILSAPSALFTPTNFMTTYKSGKVALAYQKIMELPQISSHLISTTTRPFALGDKTTTPIEKGPTDQVKLV
jgi:hypothetical protein